MNDLESKFKQVQEQVKIATEALLAANNLSEELGLGSLADPTPPSSIHVVDDYNLDGFYDEMSELRRPILQALRVCGWHTSSLSC